MPIEFHDGLSVHNNGGFADVTDVVTRQPTSSQHGQNNFVAFPVTLPSSVIHSPNCFLSSKVLAKSVSTQTPVSSSNPVSNPSPNFPYTLLPSGGRHCLSIIYQTEEDIANGANGNLTHKVGFS